MAKAAGIPVVLTGEGRLPEGMSDESAQDLERKTERLTAMAEKNQVYLPWNPWSISIKPADCQDSVSRQISLLGVNFDTANPHRGTMWVQPGKVLNGSLQKSPRLMSRCPHPVARLVRHVHIKDVVGKRLCPW